MPIAAEALRTFAGGILEREGLPPRDAATASSIIVEADLRGVHSHGVSLLPAYVRRLRNGLINPKPNITTVRERGATAVIDGDFGMGHVVGHTCMTLAIDRAREHGIGFATARRSTHYGIAGYYAMMALEAQMIGYSTSNAVADMVPWQGADPILSNAPLAYAIPARRHPPLVLDMACSVVARGKIRMAQVAGSQVPAGWVVGDEPDPHRAFTIPLMPFGTYKGSGLAVIGEALSTILPAAKLSIDVLRAGPAAGESRDPRGVGHACMAIDVAALRPVDEFLDDVDRFIDAIKGARPAVGYEEVLAPGEIEQRCRDEAARNGVSLPTGVVNMMRDLANETGARFPD
jgi:LDH2 family malate/lactate/ureidoglycolate dehydrogenase